MSAEILPWDALAPERRLFLDHLRGETRARALFGGRGWDDDAVAAAAEERRRVPLPHREALATELALYALSLGSESTAEAARRLTDPRAVVVVGGQQPGVAGGPLLAFAKAIGVIALAKRLEKAGAGPVVPVWWVASEDHDLAEAGSVWLTPGRKGADLLEGNPADRRMLSEVPGPARDAVLGEMGGGEFRDVVERLLPASPKFSLGRHTGAIFAELLGPLGLVVVEPAEIRGFATEIFGRDIREPGAVAARVREGNAAVRRAGYATVLADPDGPLHFRVHEGGRRERGGGREGDLANAGVHLSADVVLRVLVQDAALPVVAQVGGPTELEYLAAIHPAREAVGVFAPCAVPRPGVTILEARVEESLREFGADLARLYRDGAAALGAAGGADAPLAGEARRLRGELDRAAGDAASHPPAVRSRLGRVRDGLEELAAAAERAAAERRGVGESRRRKVLDALLPDGVPQERRWSLLPFLLRHGPVLWARLVEECSGPEPGHRVIRA